MGRLLVAGVVVLALTASTAAAQGRRQGTAGDSLHQARAARQAAIFQRLDKNNDGAISRDEWPRGERGFVRADANKDGVLSRGEVAKLGAAIRRVRVGQATARRARMIRTRLRRMDANHDRVISRDEFRGTSEVFDRLDTNHDGQLTSAELRVRTRRR